ncbi:MAG: substrate-binding domain-containing protein [Planctomycetes bacterium]|nr:substrate-binding domain-containing protein [Planctomycetota bacterium]
MRKAFRTLALLLAVATLASWVVPTCVSAGQFKGANKNRKDLVVGVSWKTFQEERWVTELNIMKDYCEAEGITFYYQVAENDAQKQAGQIENLVSQGIDILIAQSNEKEAIDNALKDAHAHGVLVCYYEQVDGETYFDLSGGNDQYEIGQAITRTIGEMNITGNVAYLFGDSTGGTGVMKFHDGMKDSMKHCDINVIGEQWVPNWDPAVGMAHAENWIAAYGDNITAILCMNDGLAGGAVQALRNEGLEGKVLTCGQDADLLAIKRILEGTQVSTVAKSGIEYPRLFLETCIKFCLGELTAADFEHTDVNSLGETKPFMMYKGTVVTKDNIDETIIAAGIYTREQVYGK